MSAPPTGPGKTAPRINADFLAFDPIKSSTLNVLADHPPPLGDAPPPAPHRDSCKHDFTTKVAQSVLPPLDTRPNASTQHKAAVVCMKCRIHADIRLDYRQAVDACPNAECPLHHFQRTPAGDENGEAHLTYAWQCSSSICRAALMITFKVPRLSTSEIAMLTDTGRLKRRFEELQQREPGREGMRQATPPEALTRLRKYVKDSVNPEHTKRTFAANNKRFMEAFGWLGHESSALLQRLGFTYAENPDPTWTLPAPPPVDDRWQANGQSQREVLQDVEMELLALCFKVAVETKSVNTLAAEKWSSANNDIERTLGAQGYPRHAALRRAQMPAEHAPYFASLGALHDFADTLVGFAYDRQAICDVEHQAYYFECLRDIATSRSSDDLLTKATMLTSEGVVSRRDLNEAYGSFGLPRGGGGADDERILNLYQAQQADLGPAASDRAREMLFRLGNARGSRMLINAAQQLIETVDEALAWLGSGVDKDTPDDMLLSVFTLKTEGDPGKEEVGRKAISVIAKARQSSQLHSWVETGRTDGYKMSVDEALRHLGIEQAFDATEATLWPQIFESARVDRPGVQTDRAIAAVQQALTQKPSAHAVGDWPVGLTSHGNTCYLNSLLQYYFSVKPLRDIVLNYDKYKFDVSAAAEKVERVGQRQISPLEIKGGQKFAEDLRHLFLRMIKDPSSAVKPEQDLVCRAFLDPKDSDLWDTNRKQSTEPVIEESVAEENTTDGPKPEDEERQQSGESDATLQGEQGKDVHMAGGDLPPTPPASPGQKPKDASSTIPPPLPPRRFSTTTNAALARAEQNATQQQDVTEVHDGIQFRLRAGMHPMGRDASGEQVDELLRLFSISLTETPVKEGMSLKSKELADSAIQLNVPNESTDIYSALDAVFDQQTVEGHQHLERYKSITKMPPFLQINIPRVGFDKEKGEQFKSEHSIRLVDELYLDRYFVAGGDDILARRRNAWGWRKKIAELRKDHTFLVESGCGTDGPTAIAETSKYINGLGDINKDLEALGGESVEFNPNLPSILAETASQSFDWVRELETEISSMQGQLDAQFSDLKQIKYRLQAVFFHRGKTAHGHYWVCIHDFANDMWRRYNDERVEELPPDKLHELYEANEWAHGTPTYAVYVRDDLKADYVQAVCRDPERQLTPEPLGPDWVEATVEPAASSPEPASAAPSGTIDPQMLAKDGGQQVWDPNAPTPEAHW